MTSSVEGFEVHMPCDFAAALAATRAALKAEGFGVITEIDLEATFQEKLGFAFRPYAILGACNPKLAYDAITADSSVGLLLPCNVTVEAEGDDHAVVRLMDPEAMLASAPGGVSVAMQEVAADGHARMLRVAEALHRLA
jgi:uncharacterized protein (DUF302 family)